MRHGFGDAPRAVVGLGELGERGQQRRAVGERERGWLDGWRGAPSAAARRQLALRVIGLDGAGREPVVLRRGARVLPASPPLREGATSAPSRVFTLSAAREIGEQARASFSLVFEAPLCCVALASF